MRIDAKAKRAVASVGALLGVVLLVGSGAQAAAPVARAAATCADYSNQAAAQRAADTRDADGDGVYCESLPCPCSAAAGDGTAPDSEPQPRSDGCKRTKRSVLVRFSRRRWPNIADHIADVRGRYPSVLHLDRPGAAANRREATRGIPTRKGYDRDEYPPALSREGGAGADVRYVRSSENRSAGAYLGNRLRSYCNRQAFRMTVGR
jgi:Deoxyribonuclease NucA/NucB